jgi:hypothetical protein
MTRTTCSITHRRHSCMVLVIAGQVSGYVVTPLTTKVTVTKCQLSAGLNGAHAWKVDNTSCAPVSYTRTLQWWDQLRTSKGHLMRVRKGNALLLLEQPVLRGIYQDSCLRLRLLVFARSQQLHASMNLQPDEIHLSQRKLLTLNTRYPNSRNGEIGYHPSMQACHLPPGHRQYGAGRCAAIK